MTAQDGDSETHGDAVKSEGSQHEDHASPAAAGEGVQPASSQACAYLSCKPHGCEHIAGISEDLFEHCVTFVDRVLEAHSMQQPGS